MKKFEFSLKTVYKMKELKDKELKDRMSLHNRALAALEEEMRLLDAELLRESKKYDEECKKGTTVQKMQNYGLYFRSYTKTKRDKQIKKSELLFEIEKLKQQLIAIMNELKALDKIYDKEYAEYLKELKAEEDKDIDNHLSYQVYMAL